MKFTFEEQVLVEAARVSGMDVHTILCLIANEIYAQDKVKPDNLLPQWRAVGEEIRLIERGM